MRGRASIHVNASPHELYAVVSDVTRTPEWSPECYRTEWIEGATGPAVGARFQGWNRVGKRAKWSTKPTVDRAEPGTAFGFDTGSTRWLYTFEPEDGGTRLTESFDVYRTGPRILDFVTTRLIAGIKDREADLQANVERSLERIKAVAERPPAEAG